MKKNQENLFIHNLSRGSRFKTLRYITRILWYGAVLVILSMIYWSSLLQEEKIQKLSRDIKQLNDQVEYITEHRESHISTTPTSTVAIEQEIENPRNLLHKDPYYLYTLPKILGKSFRPHGTLRLASIGKSDNLHPFSDWGYVLEWTSYAQHGLAQPQFGTYTKLAPDIALSIEQDTDPHQDVCTFIIRLRRDLFWQPIAPSCFQRSISLADHFLQKHPVTAHDFQLHFSAIRNPHIDIPATITLRQLLSDVISVTARDDYTLEIAYKKIACADGTYITPYAAPFRILLIRPLARFLYLYDKEGNKLCDDEGDSNFYMKSSVWAQLFMHHFALNIIPSCGPYTFTGATTKTVRFQRNQDFYTPLQALYHGLEINLLEDSQAIWRDFISQKIDICTIPPQNIVEIPVFQKTEFYKQEEQRGHRLETVEYLGRSFYYAAFNMKKPLFTSKKIRQALSMAIDYKNIIHQALYDRAESITGPFFKESTAYDTTIPQWHFDQEKAKRLLAEEGWFDADGTGIMSKKIDDAITHFQFSLIYHVQDTVAKEVCNMIAGYLRQIGIHCFPRGLNTNDLSTKFADKDFDMLYLGWQLATPPEDPEQLWSSRGADQKGSSNMVGFSNAQVDQLIEQLKIEHDEKKRMETYHHIHRILHEECPYIFLFSPKVTLAYWNWIKNLIIPNRHQDMIPGATVSEPSPLATWKEIST